MKINYPLLRLIFKFIFLLSFSAGMFYCAFHLYMFPYIMLSIAFLAYLPLYVYDSILKSKQELEDEENAKKYYRAWRSANDASAKK